MYKKIKEIYKKSGGLGGIYKDCLLLLFLAAVVAVFVLAMLISNLESIPKQNMSIAFSENS